MKRSVIIYGPQGCGKTINGEALRAVYGCDRIDDTDSFYSGGHRFDPKAGHLYLTCDPKVLTQFPEHVVHFDEAIKRVANPRIVAA